MCIKNGESILSKFLVGVYFYCMLFIKKIRGSLWIFILTYFDLANMFCTVIH